MSIIYNGTTCTDIKYNDTILDKVIYNNTIVYQRITVNYYCENSIYKSTKVISGNNVDLSSNNAASKSGWSFLGWRTDKTANGTVESSITAGTSTINLYAVYRQTITLTYNGNGATSGSTASQTGYRYYNNGNITNPSFTLRSNGFSRTNYKFVNWRQGSTSGTARNPGTSIALSSNTTFYASWEASTTYRTVTKSVKTAINNWHSTRSLVEYGYVFSSNPSVSISGDKGASVSTAFKSGCVIKTSHATGGGEWTANITASGNAYINSGSSGIVMIKGQFEAVIDNWSGGSRTINFGRTFKSPPTVVWYTPNPSSSSLADDWTINITNITTTSFTISWGASTGGARHDLGWVAEGSV